MPEIPSRYLGQFRPEFSRLYEDRDLYWITPFFAPRVLGVVGQRFAGVSSAIEYLVARHGYRAYTLGSELRRIAQELGVPASHRRHLQDLGDEIRTAERDPAYLARRVLRRIRDDYLREPPWAVPRSLVIGGIKTTEERKVLSALHNFEAVVIEVDNDDLRFRRALEGGRIAGEYEAERSRELDKERRAKKPPTWDRLSPRRQREFFRGLDRIHEEGHPGSSPQEYKGAPAKVIAQLEDPLTVSNEGDLGQLHAEIDRVLSPNMPPALGH